MKYLLLKITWGATMLVLVAWIAYSGLTMPMVTLSHSTSKCVKVEPPSAGDCDNLPRKYATQWSK